MYRESLSQHADPVEAWAAIVEDPGRSRLYKSQRGKGGFVRSSWPEAVEMIAAAHVYTIKKLSLIHISVTGAGVPVGLR